MRSKRSELEEVARELLVEADRMLASGDVPRQRFREALERLRAVVPPPPPPPPSKRKPGRLLTQEEWDQRVLVWALDLPKGTRITPPSAMAALSDPDCGEVERNAIATSLTRLPADEFTSSWYPSGTSLAPVWERR